MSASSLFSNLSPRKLALAELPKGALGRVCGLEGDANTCSRLREMGFCESATITRISGERTLVCQLCGTRVALSEGAARHILVELIRGGV